jgi:uncharacterized delta-60 repeat protein
VHKPHFMLARFTPHGALDVTFGVGGRVATLLADADLFSNPVITAVTRQANGRYVAAGSFVSGSSLLDDILVARFHSTGTFDTSFGNGGMTRLDVAGQRDAGMALVLQPVDGKIVVAGMATVGGNENFVLVRYNTNGHLDQTFGFGGGVTTDFQGADVARAVIVQPDDAILVTGGAGNQAAAALARYRPDGQLDASFGNGGTVMTDISGGEGRAIALRGNGQIVVSGVTRVTGQFFGDMLVAQYTSDGTLDTTFGREGLAVTDFDDQVDAGRADVAFVVAIQPDDKIVAAGVADFNQTGSFAITRYLVPTRCGPGIEC